VNADLFRIGRRLGGKDQIQNRWEVRGVEYKSGGCDLQPWALATGSNPRLGATQRVSRQSFQSDIIQSSRLARMVARRLMRWYNREGDEVTIETLNDPDITPGRVIGVRDAVYGIGLAALAPYTVVTIDRQGSFMTLTCVGGAAGNVGTITGGLDRKCNKTTTEEPDVLEPLPDPTVSEPPEVPEEPYLPGDPHPIDPGTGMPDPTLPPQGPLAPMPDTPPFSGQPPSLSPPGVDGVCGPETAAPGFEFWPENGCLDDEWKIDGVCTPVDTYMCTLPGGNYTYDPSQHKCLDNDGEPAGDPLHDLPYTPCGGIAPGGPGLGPDPTFGGPCGGYWWPDNDQFGCSEDGVYIDGVCQVRDPYFCYSEAGNFTYDPATHTCVLSDGSPSGAEPNQPAVNDTLQPDGTCGPQSGVTDPLDPLDNAPAIETNVTDEFICQDSAVLGPVAFIPFREFSGSWVSELGEDLEIAEYYNSASGDGVLVVNTAEGVKEAANDQILEPAPIARLSGEVKFTDEDATLFVRVIETTGGSDPDAARVQFRPSGFTPFATTYGWQARTENQTAILTSDATPRNQPGDEDRNNGGFGGTPATLDEWLPFEVEFNLSGEFQKITITWGGEALYMEDETLDAVGNPRSWPVCAHPEHRLQLETSGTSNPTEPTVSLRGLVAEWDCAANPDYDPEADPNDDPKRSETNEQGASEGTSGEATFVEWLEQGV
jgi:hypothetical protein